MKNKRMTILATVLALVLMLLPGCGRSSSTSKTKPTSPPKAEATAKPTEKPAVEDTESSESASEPEPEPKPSASPSPEPSSSSERAFEVTIPARVFGDLISKEDIEDIIEGSGYASSERNNDGSVTYYMTEEQHDDLVEKITGAADDAIDAFLDSGVNSNITAIVHSDDFKDFTVTLSTSNPGLLSSVISLGLNAVSGLYSSVAQDSDDDIHITFVDKSGKVIEEFNSKSLK